MSTAANAAGLLHRYPVFEQQYWPKVTCGPATGLAMDAFFVLTGTLAGVSLVPHLQDTASLSAEKVLAATAWRCS